MNSAFSAVLIAVLVSLLTLVVGCAQQVAVPADATRAELRTASTIRVIHVASEPLRVATPAAAIGGLVGWAVDREMGKSWAKKAGADTVTDPIVGVKERFVRDTCQPGRFPERLGHSRAGCRQRT